MDVSDDQVMNTAQGELPYVHCFPKADTGKGGARCRPASCSLLRMRFVIFEESNCGTARDLWLEP